MIAVGERGPDFELRDQFGRRIRRDLFTGRAHTLVLFYPLDFTPT